MEQNHGQSNVKSCINYLCVTSHDDTGGDCVYMLFGNISSSCACKFICTLWHSRVDNAFQHGNFDFHVRYVIPLLTLGAINFDHVALNLNGTLAPVPFNWPDVFLSIPRGIGQVYLCDNWISGVLIWIGIVISSR